MIYFPYSIICGCWAGYHSKPAILGKRAEFEILKYISRICARAILKRYTSSLFLWNTFAVKAPGMLLFGQLYDSIGGLVSFDVLLTHFRCLCQQNLNLSSWQKTNLPHKPALILSTPPHRQGTAKTVFVKVALTLSKSVSAERGRFSANNSACPSQDGPPALPNKAVKNFCVSFMTTQSLHQQREGGFSLPPRQMTCWEKRTKM